MKHRVAKPEYDGAVPLTGDHGRIPAIVPYDLDAVAWSSFDRTAWAVSSDRAALLVHDMQGFYTSSVPTGLGLRDTVVSNTALVLESCRANGLPVFYSVAKPCADRAERGLLHDFYGMGMKDVPEHRAVEARLAPAEPDRVIVKKNYSAFYATELADLLRAAEISRLIICGVYAHIGCLTSAMDAFMRDIQVFYVADAMAAFSLDHHIHAARYVGEVCASVQTTKLVLAGLSRGNAA
jgi:bifunctional isochorismate lyase/aryl carrier protein